jgi:hypothetical protein
MKTKYKYTGRRVEKGFILLRIEGLSGTSVEDLSKHAPYMDRIRNTRVR